VADLISARAGLKTQRGDQVVVERMALAAKQQAEAAQQEAEKLQAAQKNSRMLSAGLRYGVLLLLGLIIGGAVLLAARQMRRGLPPAGSSAVAEVATALAERVAASAAAPEFMPEGEAPSTYQSSPELEARLTPAEQQLEQIARENPRLVAQHIRKLIGSPEVEE
jgi:flagellar biosynthesis/type III secretory pathway M-ring protein FliF/YscJ